MHKKIDIVIVGTGNAGFSAAKAAREHAPSASILLIGEEDLMPFNRTNLSKTLAVGFQKNEFQLQPPEWYAESHIELALNRRAGALEPEGHQLILENGDTVTWNKLVLATGARPVWPAGVDRNSPYLYALRTAQSAEALMAAARSAKSVLVVGMGVLGVEIAEQMVKLGKRVTLAGNAVAMMPRQLNVAASDRMKAEFESHGVELLFGEPVPSVVPGEGRPVKALLSLGERQVDLCVISLGVAPCVELAKDAGLAVKRGIVVDQWLRTTHPDIYAAGDVAEHPNGQITAVWRAAGSQGTIAGTNAAGGEAIDDQLPFRLKTEVFGHYYFSVNRPAATELPAFETIESRSGSFYWCFYIRDGLVQGAVMVDDGGRWKDYEAAAREHWPKEKAISTFEG